MLRKILGVLAGAVAANVVIFALETLGHKMYPPPADLNWQDGAAVAAWFTSLPAWAFAWLLVGYALGCLTGGLTATLVAGRTTLVPGIVVGVLVTIGGILNMIAIPHPLWLAIATLLTYVPFAYLGSRLVRRPAAA